MKEEIDNWEKEMEERGLSALLRIIIGAYQILIIKESPEGAEIALDLIKSLRLSPLEKDIFAASFSRMADGYHEVLIREFGKEGALNFLRRCVSELEEELQKEEKKNG